MKVSVDDEIGSVLVFVRLSCEEGNPEVVGAVVLVDRADGRTSTNQRSPQHHFQLHFVLYTTCFSSSLSAIQGYPAWYFFQPCYVTFITILVDTELNGQAKELDAYYWR
jgi:hypothetical protein